MELSEGQKSLLKRILEKNEISNEDYYAVVESLEELAPNYDIKKTANKFKHLFDIPLYDESKAMNILYTNYRGENSRRKIYPIEITYGVTEYHTTPTHLLRAYDFGKKAERTFDMAYMIMLHANENKDRFSHIEVVDLRNNELC